MRYVLFNRKLVPNFWFYVAAFVVFAAIYGLVSPPVTLPKTVDRSDACFMAQKFVKEQLKAPATAQFPIWTEENCQVTQRNRIWVVRSYVDAENGFGALLRNDYTAELIYYPATDSWTLTNLQFTTY